MYDIGISIYSTLCILRISTATKINSKKVLRLALLMKQQGYTGYLKLGGQVVMRHTATAWRRLLICQSLGGQLPTLTPHNLRP